MKIELEIIKPKLEIKIEKIRNAKQPKLNCIRFKLAENQKLITKY